MISSCPHIPKVIEVVFDTGSLQKEDVWKLCKDCCLKPEFRHFRIHEKRLEESN